MKFHPPLLIIDKSLRLATLICEAASNHAPKGYARRFSCFPVQSDDHLLTVLRYLERNALSAGLVDWAEDWRWGA